MKLDVIAATFAGYLAAFGLTERPQTPSDRDYVVEHHRLPGGSPGVTLDAELTVPSGSARVPGVVLITGSGPQNKNEEVAGHKPFLVLSDFLTKQGLAVLRYDDRGVGKSTGDFASVTPSELAADAAAAMRFLKLHPRVAGSKTGYIGHSEGGYLAPIAHKQSSADFHIFLAAPALRLLPDVMATQVADIARAEGVPESEIDRQLRAVDEVVSLLRSAKTRQDIRGELSLIFKRAGANRSQIKENVELWSTPWAKAYVRHDPGPYLETLNVPVLAVFGEHDLQVSPRINAPVMEKMLRHPKSKTLVLAGLNHLLQPTETGRVSEYVRIPTTIDPTALDTIGKWVKTVTGN
ncbi:alpha/beta hydrolase [uncultured Roseibium sp.]|uniref:alpha/beta hydrolase family protein n=1 Tax=uncultured Roseibium sp. TaxID=1936171 RepID=UPI002605645C|nr:alpha/beta hydrolase [uncultured Roseibium sp.]